MDNLVRTIESHVILPSGAAIATALWVIHAHAHDQAQISPILAISSPTPECGKTTLLNLIGALVPRPQAASNITPAAVFRTVEKYRPCLLVDEADTFLKNSDDLRGILNSGHNRQSAFIIRSVGDDHDPRPFRTWGPKAIAVTDEDAEAWDGTI
jgi:putative DNA primase/helicase